MASGRVADGCMGVVMMIMDRMRRGLRRPVAVRVRRALRRIRHPRHPADRQHGKSEREHEAEDTPQDPDLLTYR